MRRRYLKNTGPTLPGFEMCENAAGITSSSSTSSAAEFRVNPRVLPASDEARAMTVGSGQRLLGLLGNSNQSGAYLKMFLAYFLLSKVPYSTHCYLTWKRTVTSAGRSIYQLAPSMPRTGENGFSLWPTPQEHNFTRPGSGTIRRGGRQSDLVVAVGGQLNPTWVEWLQGFPMNWTEV